MISNRHHDPRNTSSQLGRAYWQHHARVMAETQPKIMGHITTAVLEGIESFATNNPESPVARMREEMLQVIGSDTLAGDPDVSFLKTSSAAEFLAFQPTGRGDFRKRCLNFSVGHRRGTRRGRMC